MATKCNIKNCVSYAPVDACLRISRDTDLVFEVVLTDGRGIPVDISASQVEFLVKDEPGGTQKLSLLNDTTEHMDGPNGRTSFAIAHDDFSETTRDRLNWVFEVWRIKASGQQMLHIAGAFVLEATI